MRFSYRWLREYLHIQKSLDEILDGFTMSGLEVETVLDLGAQSGLIVIGQIREISPHPNADNLSLCQVEAGQGRPLRIVCGATNMKEGDKAAVALEGAVLSGGMVIKHTRIRGEVSEGMLCAGDELGLSDDHSGILILPEDFPVGEPLDAVIDISVTPNRGDCLSIVGLARDLAGYFNSRLALPPVRVNETMDRIENYLKVTVENREGCPRYGARYIRGVRVGPSPSWLVYRLQSAGIRSLNNIVDATNYVMLETGHPIHAFDLDRVANRHIIIRSARKGEEIETLDEEMIPLEPDDLLITDPREPIALAGLMGGLISGISRSTINVVLECAYFDPVTIRKTSRRLGKQTEASFRFERDVDREGIPRVLDRVATLIQQLAGGEIVQGIVDVKNYRTTPNLVSLSVQRTNEVLGEKLGARQIADYLVALGFEITNSNPEKITFSVPSFRTDIVREIDLIEEVARMYGYEKVKPTLPYLPAAPSPRSPLSCLKERIRGLLTSLGFDEAINYSFTSSRLTTALGLPVDRAIRLTNPISSEQDIMRTSLLPGFLEVISHNLNREELNLRLFEIGKIFRHEESGNIEETRLIAGMCGERPGNWQRRHGALDFYDIKGAAVLLCRDLGLGDATLEPLEGGGYYHPKRTASLVYENREICRFGEIHPLLMEQLELKRRLYLLEMPVEGILSLTRRRAQFHPIPRFPSVTRDLAVILEKSIPARDVEMEIRHAAGTILESLEVFDLYTGDPVPEEKKSLAYSLTFRASDRTLTDAEINDQMESLIRGLKEKFNATLR